MESPTHGAFHLPQVPATADPAEVGPAELVLMSVKSYDLDEAARAIGPLLGPETAVLPLLNGVDIAERIGAVIGAERVLGGVVYLSSNIVEPGVIRQVSNAPFCFGELEGGRSARGEAILAAMQGAEINAVHTDDVRGELWRKFVMVNGIAGTCALTRTGLKPILADPDTRAFFVATLREGEALALAQQVRLEPDLVERTVSFAESLAPHYKPSLLLDLERGRRLELEALKGTAVRLGQELGVPTPCNTAILAALKPHADGPPLPPEPPAQ